MTAKVLTIALVLSGFIGFSISATRIATELPHANSQIAPGEKFLPLIPLIKGETEVGFFTYQSPENYIKELYQAQYALTPVIVRENTEPRFVVVSNLHPPSVEELRERLGATIVASFPESFVYLLQQ